MLHILTNGEIKVKGKNKRIINKSNELTEYGKKNKMEIGKKQDLIGPH